VTVIVLIRRDISKTCAGMRALSSRESVVYAATRRLLIHTVRSAARRGSCRASRRSPNWL